MDNTDITGAEAHSFLTALARFVVPFVEMHSSHGNIDISQLADSMVGRDLIMALGKFLAFKVKAETLSSSTEIPSFDGEREFSLPPPPPLSPFHTSDYYDEKEEKEDSPQEGSYFINQLPYSSSSDTEIQDEYSRRTPPLLEEAMNKTRHFVFNKMPIRLLTFDTNGSNIRLIGRPEIWQNISKRIVQDYDGEAMKSEISRILSSKVWGDTKNKAIEVRDDAIRNFCAKYEQYAILSHTWIQDTPGEVVYSDWIKQSFAVESPGHKKLVNFCRVAATEHDATLAWMDTVCINKESSAELDESIRSMYKWYQSATVCITYLAGTMVVDQIHADPWFTRGWTLQELLSPDFICFYLKDWKQVSLVNFWEDSAVTEQILSATSIAPDEMKVPMNYVSISRRMQWTKRRNVTREEDAAYSLMGIFGISMSTAYGEGAEHAFFRLVKEILASNSPSPLDIVNWGHGEGPSDSASGLSTSQLIPSTPQQYLHSASTPFRWGSTRVPITLTQKGLHVSALLMPAELKISTSEPTTFPPFTPRGNFFARTTAMRFANSFNPPLPSSCYDILPGSLFTASEPLELICDTFFAVLNHSETAYEIKLHGNVCFAVSLDGHKIPSVPPHDGDVVIPRRTENPITFILQQLEPNPRTTSEIRIKKTELEKHGMFLRTLYM